MTLRARILLFGSFGLLLQILLFLTVNHYSLAPKVDTLEKKLVEENLHRGLGLFERERYHQKHLTRLFAELPLVQQIVSQTQPASSAEAHILEAKMLQFEVNAISIISNDDKVLWQQCLDLAAKKPYPKQSLLTDLFESRPQFFEHAQASSLQSGFFNTPLGPFSLISAPIMDPNTQTIRGTMILGKLITPEMIQLFQDLSYTDLKLWPTDGASLGPSEERKIRQIAQGDADFLIEQDSRNYQGYLSLQDLTQKISLLLSTTQSRVFFQNIELSLFELGFYSVLLQIVLLIVLLWLTRRSISEPLETLIQYLDKTTLPDNTDKEWQALLLTNPSGDILKLNTALSLLISRQATLIKQETNLAYRDGNHQARKNISLELNDTLIPIIESVAFTEKKLSELPINALEWIIAQTKTGQVSLSDLPEVSKELQAINEILQRYRKETRRRLHELHLRALRHAAVLRTETRNADMNLKPLSRTVSPIKNKAQRL